MDLALGHLGLELEVLLLQVTNVVSIVFMPLLRILIIDLQLVQHRIEPVQAGELFILLQDLEQVGDTEREAIVRNEAADVLSLAQDSLVALRHVVDVVDRQRRYNQVEQFEVLDVLLVENTIEVAHNHTQVITGLVRLREQVLDAHVEHLDSLDGLTGDSQIGRHVLKLDLLHYLRQVLDEVGVVLETSAADHAYVTESITNVSDELAELVKVRHAAFSGAQSFDVPGNSLSALVRIHITQALLVLAIEALLLQKRIMNELVVQEFVEDVQLLDEEFVERVDYGTHDTDAVSLDGVEHLVDANSLDLFGLYSRLDERLRVQIVVVL